jgi:hypothetical protein
MRSVKNLVQMKDFIWDSYESGVGLGELMADHRITQAAALRRAIDCLPVRTRQAMLAGIQNNTIVVGAYAIEDGVCPMLAAHRNGGRTDFIAFARSWDEYCFRGVRQRRRKPRLATPTELATLRAHIETSLLAEESVDLAGAVAQHQDLMARRELAARAERERLSEGTLAEAELEERGLRAHRLRPAKADRVRPGDPDRSKELSRRHGWRWMRIMRTYDEYAEAMASLDESEAGATEPELTHSRD